MPLFTKAPLTAITSKIIFHASTHSAAEVEARFPDAKLLVTPCPPTEMLEAVCALLMRQPTEA